MFWLVNEFPACEGELVLLNGLVVLVGLLFVGLLPSLFVGYWIALSYCLYIGVADRASDDSLD